MLSTAHCHQMYKSGNELHVAKFMPWFDGPYPIIKTNKKHSTVTLALPKDSHHFPIFHTSEVKPFQENNDDLFLSQALHPPNPITINGTQEFFMDKIMNKQRRGQRRQYLVRWRGEGPEGDMWLSAEELEDCMALNVWLEKKTGQRPQEHKQLTITIPPRPGFTSEQGGV